MSLQKESALLVRRAKALSDRERRITARFIFCLLDIQERRAYASQGYCSLFELCTEEFGYSAAAAQRRIYAMKVIEAVPEARKALSSGLLSLSNAYRLQGFFQNHEITDIDEKKRIIENVLGKSARDCERYLISLAPEAVPAERERIVSETQTQISFVVSENVRLKLQRIKGLWAHRNPRYSYAVLIEEMADRILADYDPDTTSSTAQKPFPTPETVEPPSSGKPAEARAEVGPNSNSRHIPKRLRMQIWKRDGGRCTFVSSNGKRCSSNFALQVDHVLPHALSGSNDPENLRLLCGLHNRHAADLAFGRIWKARPH